MNKLTRAYLAKGNQGNFLALAQISCSHKWTSKSQTYLIASGCCSWTLWRMAWLCNKSREAQSTIVTNTLVTICWLIKKTLMDVKCKRMLSFSSQDQNCWLISNQGLPGSRTSPKIFCEVHSSLFLPSIKCSFSGKGFPSVCYKAGLTNL